MSPVDPIVLAQHVEIVERWRIGPDGRVSEYAIDNIPSIVDDLPYASYTVLYGDESDGVPVPLDGGETFFPKPRFAPKASVILPDYAETRKVRR